MKNKVKRETELSRQPQAINERNWYYEEYSGIMIVHEVVDKNGNYVQTDQFKIPWKKLLVSCERKFL